MPLSQALSLSEATMYGITKFKAPYLLHSMQRKFNRTYLIGQNIDHSYLPTFLQ